MAYEGYKDGGGEDILPLKVSVVAPSTLPGGYTFEAYVNDDQRRPFTCEVPEGGVAEGQRFWVPLPPLAGDERIRAPTGRWKDGLFDCCSAGACHPSLCCAVWCDKVSLAQIMTRMSLTWLGEPGPGVSTKNTFAVVVALFVAYTVFANALELASLEFTPDTLPVAISVLKAVGGFFFAVWSVYAVCKTRQSVRDQYSIPEERCGGCEDLCCSVFCTCCTLSQMARHTGEYETYRGVCCTSTGHPAGTPLTV